MTDKRTKVRAALREVFDELEHTRIVAHDTAISVFGYRRGAERTRANFCAVLIHVDASAAELAAWVDEIEAEIESAENEAKKGGKA